MTISNVTFLRAGVLLAAVCSSHPVFAGVTQVAHDDNGVADIIVTATHRETNQQKTAIPLTTITSGDLKERGVNALVDLSQLIPAIKIGQLGGGNMQLTVRGIGTFGGSATAEQGVALNVDGVYQAHSPGFGGLFYDVNRVELLKGPQGTLYGRNSTGGVLNIVTNDPGKNLAMEFTGEYGNANHVRAEAALNIPVSDVIAIRIAGQKTVSDGFTSTGNGREDNYAGRIKVKITPTPRLSVLLEASYAQNNAGLPLGGFLFPGYNPFKDPITTQNAAIPPGLPLIGTDDLLNNTSRGLQGTVNYDFGPVTTTLIVSNTKLQTQSKFYGAGFPVTDNTRGAPSYTTTAELRFASHNNGPFKWQIGGFYLNDSLHTNITFDQGVTFGTPFTLTKTKSYSGFAEGTYALTSRLRFTAGGRYTSDNKSLSGFASSPVGGPGIAPFGGLPNAGALAGFVAATCPAALGASYNPAFTLGPLAGFPFTGGTCTAPIIGQKTFNKFTWKIGIEGDIGPHSLAYATVATGFKGGGFYNSLDTSNSTTAAIKQGNSFLPETITAYTIGIKNRFFDNKLQLNLEAYYWKYKDKQITLLGLTQPSNSLNLVTQNAGAANIYGFELEGAWKPTPRDNFNFDVQYTKSEYTSFSYLTYYSAALGASPPLGCANPGGTTLVPNGPFAVGQVDCSGKPISLTPDWTINLGYHHIFELGNAGTLVAGVETQIQSSFWLGEEYVASERQSSSMISNASLTWSSRGNNFSVTGYVKNIENERLGGGSFQYPFTGQALVLLNPPITYGARVNFKF